MTLASPSSATRVGELAAPRVFTLHPGDVARGDRGDRLETLLGSCVAIVITDPRRTVGVMCHIVHSRPRAGAGASSGAHADVARERMHALLRERGMKPSLCEAYVYGGGNMFPDLFQHAHVGADNACWALASLAEDGVRVLLHDVGGTAYRRLAWTVGTGMPVVTAVEV